MKTKSNKKLMRLTLLVFAWVMAISVFAQEDIPQFDIEVKESQTFKTSQVNEN